VLWKGWGAKLYLFVPLLGKYIEKAEYLAWKQKIYSETLDLRVQMFA
jgi:hypothetical protein